MARPLPSPSAPGHFLPPQNRVALFNGATGLFTNYRVGQALSSDGGRTWTPYASNPVISNAGSGWRGAWVKDPCILWDGTQYVAYISGYDNLTYLAGTYRIGRFTSPDGITWTSDAGNPVVDIAAGVTAGGVSFPTVIYRPDLSPAWRMWTAGWTTHTSETGITIIYFDSTDGVTWTSRGRVLNVGTGFESIGLVPGCVILTSGAAGRLFYSGFDGSFYKAASASFTDPANAATYTKLGQLAAFTGSITLAGRTWRSNQPRGIRPQDGGYRCFVTLWNPTVGAYEMGATTTASDLDTWAAPTAQMFTIPGSGWDSDSAENPSVLVLP